MKSLNEVIMEVYQHDCSPDFWDDVYHYLKEYQNKEMFYNQAIDHWVQMINEQEDRVTVYLAEMNKNDPLSWDELRTMVGKPVWIEFPKGNYKWGLVYGFDKETYKYSGRILIQFNGYTTPHFKEGLGTDWWAYRKENK